MKAEHFQTSHFTLHTLKAPFERSGVGLHTGKIAKVTVMPAIAGKGCYFVRTDLPGQPLIPATIDAVRQATLSTELAIADTSVRTVEHLLAALAAMGIDNARIEVDGPEIPLLDGSALPWVEAISEVGAMAVDGTNLSADHSNFGNPNHSTLLRSPIWVHQDDAFVAALPAPALRFTYGIDFDVSAIGNQWHSWFPTPGSFPLEIAPARTFGLLHQIEQLRNAGLIQGGSLENALVCGHDGWINPPLRFANEPVRHKILDLVGDLSLLGKFPVAHFIAYKASHKLHLQLAQLLAQSN